MVSLEINCNLSVLKVESSQIVINNLLIGSCCFCFHYKLRIPLANILIDNKQLEVSIRGVIEKFLIGQPIHWQWLFFQEASLLKRNLPVNVNGSGSDLPPITFNWSSRALKHAGLLRHEVPEPAVEDLVGLLHSIELSCINSRERSTLSPVLLSKGIQIIIVLHLSDSYSSSRSLRSPSP